MDDTLATCDSDVARDWSKSAPEIIQCEAQEEEASDIETSEEFPKKKCTLSRAVDIVQELKSFISDYGSSGMYTSVMDIEESLVEMVMSSKTKQTSIKDFFH